MSRMRTMSAMTAVTISTKRSAAIIFWSHARTSSRSGAKAEVTFSREAIVTGFNGEAIGKFPVPKVFLCGQRGGLPSRPASGARQLDAFDDQRELRGLDGDRRQSIVARKGRTEASLLEALGPHRVATAIPVHDANPIASFGEKDEQVTAERVVPEHVPNERHQAVGAFTPIDWLRRDEQPYARRKAQHAPTRRTSSSRPRAAESNDAGTRTTTPDGSTTSNGASASANEIRAVGRTISSWNVVRSAPPSRRRHEYKRCGSRPCSAAKTLTVLPERSSAASALRASSSVQRRRSNGEVWGMGGGSPRPFACHARRHPSTRRSWRAYGAIAIALGK